MSHQKCASCNEELLENAYRKNSKGVCTWCQWAPAEKRAIARYKDKHGADKKRPEDDKRLNISQDDFVNWYLSQEDCCYYCGTTMNECKTLRLRRGSFGYFVSWDIDRKDSLKPYEKGNIVLSCFMCNMAKASYFTANETKVIGSSIRKVIKARLASKE